MVLIRFQQKETGVNFQMKQIVFSMVAIIVLFFGPANAEMVKISWHTSAQSSPWIPGNEYIDGWSKNL